MKYFLFLVLCILGAVTATWTADSKLQDSASSRTWTPTPKFTLDLDAPATERWAHIGAAYKDRAPALIAYLKTMVPGWALPIITKIAAGVEPFFKDYGDEMKGLATAMDLPLGDIVVLNLIYQLESIGLNCSNWNNTGPTIPDDPGCVDIDPDQKWCYCKKSADKLDADEILWENQRDPSAGPGLCTSVVAQDPSGKIFHGRNLDWNLPDVLLGMAVDIDYQRNNATVFTGTTIVGFVGLLNGISRSSTGCPGFTMSLDARDKGGKIFENLLEMLLSGAMTPAQHLRKAMELKDYDTAVEYLARHPIVNPVYYIVAGCKAGQGVVISRDRNNGAIRPADQWALNATQPNGWYRLQTNYDHWNPVPKADDRRNPGIASMEAMGATNVNEANMRAVMEKWPVFNHHTDYTGVWCPVDGLYSSGVWLN